MITADAEWLDVFSIMVRPDDPGSLQDDYIARIAHEVPEAGTTATAAEAKERVVARYLSGQTTMMHGVEDAGGPGAIAGDVLLFLMQMERAGWPEPGIRKAQWLASEYTEKALRDGSPRVAYSVKSVREHWKEYKRAAHLWAALRVSQFEGDPRDTERLYQSTADDMKRFLGVARAFQEFADGFEPSYTRHPEPILPSDAWRIAASVPCATVTPPPLEDWAVAELNQYSNRQSRQGKSQQG